MAALVVSRLIWGFYSVRVMLALRTFSQPTYNIKAHIDDLTQRRYQGHLSPMRPFGALMMFALWAVILGLGITGYLQTTDEFWGDDTIQELHEILANSMYVLVPIHVISAMLDGTSTKLKLGKVNDYW